VDRVQLGSLECANARSIQQKFAVDAIEVHDEPFNTELLTHLQCSCRKNSTGKKNGNQRDSSEAKGQHDNLIVEYGRKGAIDLKRRRRRRFFRLCLLHGVPGIFGTIQVARALCVQKFARAITFERLEIDSFVLWQHK
jgi:hypothetical protein